MSVVLLLVSSSRQTQILLASRWRPVKSFISSNVSYSGETMSLSLARQARFGMTVAGPGGAQVSAKLKDDTSTDICICTLQSYANDNR